MKKVVIVLAALAVALVMAGPAFAASLGISPASFELEVPANGSATAYFRVHYFTGEVRVEMVDIPLRVAPETLQVDAAGGPVPVELTVYGDPSLGSKIYDGYVRFTGISGGMVNVAIKSKATVTNRVAGQEPVLVTPASTIAPETTAATQASPALQNQQTTPAGPGGVNIQPAPSSTEANTNDSDVFAGLSLNTVIIIAAGVVFLGLVILAVSVISRRRRF